MIAAAPVAANDPDWTPGRYLKARRQCAGVAGILVGLAMMARRGGQVLADAHRYADAEQDKLLLDEDELRWISATEFRFEVDVYLRLAQAMPHTLLCRECACSLFDPCSDARGQPCGWSTSDRGLCTACEERA